MWALIRDITINLISDVLSIFIALPFIFFILAIFLRKARRAKLINFFNLEKRNPSIKVFISRHTTKTQIPKIQEHGSDDINLPSEVRKLLILQEGESNEQTETYPISKPFSAVSAVEMIEFFRIKASFERPLILDWLPRELKEALSFNHSAVTGVKVNLEVCPGEDEYQKLLQAGTLIFIGGSRSNLGTYYYLYGKEAGKARPRRLDKEKEVIELIRDSGTYAGDETHNLAIIQRFNDPNQQRNIFYLAGTGVQGTASAVAYLRLNWEELYSTYSTRDFCIILECARRSDDSLSKYLALNLRNQDWRVIAEIH